jgi:hypothetical protein
MVDADGLQTASEYVFLWKYLPLTVVKEIYFSLIRSKVGIKISLKT